MTTRTLRISPWLLSAFTALSLLLAATPAQNIHGGWPLTPLDGGRATQVTYDLYSEPGGAVPSWIVNVASKDAPRDLLLAMLHRATAADASPAHASAE